MKTTEEFWNRLEKLPNGCWERIYKRPTKTYWTTKWFGKVVAGHRLAAFLSGKLPTLEKPRSPSSPDHVLHICDNKRCCNPDHLSVGSYSQNITDAYRRKRRPSKLSFNQAEEIRTAYAQGELQTDLAKRYKVSQAAISKIVRNENYKEAA